MFSREAQKMIEIMSVPPADLGSMLDKYDALEKDPSFNTNFEEKILKNKIKTELGIDMNSIKV